MEFRTLKSGELEECLSLLKKAFDRNEIRPDEEICSLFQDDKIEILGAYEQKLASCIMYWNMPDMLFLENFATAPSMRNSGIGGQVIEQLKQLEKPMILEVENPIDEITKRRVAFYKRHGFEILEQEYYLPPLQKGNPVIPFHLMVYKTTVNEEKINEIYQKIYQSQLTLADYRTLYAQQK